ncbi:PQQ-binding-like beta-propeller repeat protein [Tenacibaculum tangerinum]|uniref:PQQ-binding-like beta-propeller repeat protein n=1 Tax=Tenacibaculum tangerinum TaxID=3038772 RepID=A0ABY8L892_9FLAO|nr:PQQ-binding-like beta-propeller repeat protein [Tenacibaculum tangerinum]WGH76205.1 PQQ-binding-like beta-propeller repeat protein [Tenacibaculum tangerinum]
MRIIYSIVFLFFLFSCKEKIEFHQNLDLIWKTKDVNWSTSSLKLDSDFIYGYTMNDSVFKLNVSTGKMLWKRYSRGSYANLSPEIYKEGIYFGGADALKAFSTNGDLLWSESTSSKTIGLIIIDSIIFNTRSSKGLFANHLKNGKELWSIEPDYQLLSTSKPSLKDSLLIIGNFNYKKNIGNHLTCINLNKKDIEWEIVNKGYLNSQVIIDNKSVFFNSDSSYLKGFTYKADLVTGKILWKIRTDPEVFLKPLLNNYKLYINSYENGIICLDTKNGEIIWNTKNKNLDAGTDFILHKEILYFGTQDRKFLGINGKGEIVFKSEFEYGIGNPFIYKGDIYVNDGNGRLFKIKNTVANIGYATFGD